MSDVGLRDMLVRLHRLSSADVAVQRARDAGVIVRRPEFADADNQDRLVDREFEPSWRGGVRRALTQRSVKALVAATDDELIGFAVWDLAYRGYFGPIGVAETWRGRGIGAALLLSSLQAMREQGYAYVTIGKVGPAEFYERVCGAELIAGQAAP